MLLLFSTINIQKIFIRHNTDLLQTNERHLILRKYSVCRNSDMSPAPSLDTFVDNFWLLKQSCCQRTCPCSVTWWICHFLSHWCVSRRVFFCNFTAFFDWQRKKAWQTFDQNISNKTSTVTNLWMHWLQCKVGFLTHDNSIIFIPVSYAGRCWSCWWLPSPSWPLSVSSLPRPTVIKTEC